jgi:hypothetical protein
LELALVDETAGLVDDDQREDDPDAVLSLEAVLIILVRSLREDRLTW